MVNELAEYIRANRAAINAISGSGNVGVTSLTLGAGNTALVIGSELDDYSLEVIVATGTGVSTITQITGGTEGQIKIFVFQGTNIRLTDSNTKANGTLYLNQLPAGNNFNPQQDDILALVNIDGDGGATTNGYWKELFRTISLK